MRGRTRLNNGVMRDMHKSLHTKTNAVLAVVWGIVAVAFVRDLIATALVAAYRRGGFGVLSLQRTETKRTDAVALKMVRYRDAVSFPIPVVWKEEDEPGVQGTFYEDAPDTGTLRVSVMQWLGSSEEDGNRIVKSILLPGNVETLKQGVYLKKEVKKVGGMNL